MTKDGFTQLIDDANAFFTELAANNTKDWFSPRKDHYAATIQKPAQLLGDIMAEEFSRLSGQSHVPKVYRIYRDVRFSKDKTPLNAHLHLMWSLPGNNPFAPVVFFGAAPAYTTFGFGVPGLRGQALTRYRAFVDSWGDSLREAIDATGLPPSEWGDASLKRVPAPYPPDHPHEDLLRRKSLLMSGPMGDDWRDQPGGLVAALRARFKTTLPLQTLLNTHLSADG